jgi:hypothetical protein
MDAAAVAAFGPIKACAPATTRRRWQRATINDGGGQVFVAVFQQTQNPA